MTAIQSKPRRTNNVLGRPRGTGTQRVYEAVRSKILSLALAPGADIDEFGLVQEFDVSRTPVREALIRLSSEGLVLLHPNRGARVAPLGAGEVPEILEALELAQRVVIRWSSKRRNLRDLDAMRQECDAFREAAERKDYDAMTDRNMSFHKAISAAAGNRHTAFFHDQLLVLSLRLSRLAFANAPDEGGSYREYYEEVDAQHRAMIDAIERQDAETADRLSVAHSAVFRRRILRFIGASRAHSVPLEPVGGRTDPLPRLSSVSPG